MRKESILFESCGCHRCACKSVVSCQPLVPLAYTWPNESLIGCRGRSPALSQSRIKSRPGEADGEQKELGSLGVFSFSTTFNPTAPAFLDDAAALADPRLFTVFSINYSTT